MVAYYGLMSGIISTMSQTFADGNNSFVVKEDPPDIEPLYFWTYANQQSFQLTNIGRLVDMCGHGFAFQLMTSMEKD